MSNTDNELMQNQIRKMRNVYFVIICLVGLIELALTVRGLFIFNFARLKHRMYFYSYVFLLVASIVTFAVLMLYRKNEKYIKLVIAQTYIYSACLIVWSTYISTVDCIANGDSGMMVFIMVSISIGALLLIKPIYYGSMILFCAAAFVVTVRVAKGEFYSSGFYTNLAVFLALAMFISAHNYRISKREYEANKKLQRLSETDQLTGIYNRRHLDAQMAECDEIDKSFVFVLIDADDFKGINDTHGHAVGDACLTAVANKLVLEFGDNVYRFGGDEFAVISVYDINTTAEKIDKINKELIAENTEAPFHISAGIYKTNDEDHANAIFINTDKALYEAKKKGKCTYSVYDNKH